MNKPSVLVSFAALTLLLTAGAAQSLAGTNTVDSGDIIDRTIGTPDVKVGAFAGQTILDNSMTGLDINEETLKFPTGELDDQNGSCFADSGEETCSTANITLARAGMVLITATYEWNSDSSAEAGPQSGIVRLKIDGVEVERANPGDNVHDNSVEYPQPIIELQKLDAGSHTISLTFQEANAASDVDVRGSHIVAVRVSS